MKVQHRNIFLVIIIALLFGEIVNAQTMKIGYVNSAKIMQEFSEAKDAQKQIDAFQMKIQDSLDMFNKEYQDKLKDYQAKESMLNETARKESQQDLIMLEQRYNEFRERKLGRDGELAIVTQRLLDPIKDKVLKAIAALAKDEKLTFVFDKNEAIQILLYGDVKYDYTNLVLDRLTRGK
ncbi:MAG: OmpH family outer membrane protein [Ignavibacteriae bacterium]|nr:OmpH family outer membrane protein [Ignavibacteriota bacterium]